mmetsp:Transcript_564/g.757  ORF Transcript_564/g.757 Transcript_564/m.757 type:complete len:273 (+) Transcript_564:43-861(+)
MRASKCPVFLIICTLPRYSLAFSLHGCSKALKSGRNRSLPRSILGINLQNVPENDESSASNIPLSQDDMQGPMKMVGEREDKVGGFSAEERLGTKGTREVMLGEPKVPEKEYSVSSILKELAAIQQQGPQKYCVLGTRHCSFLHQQIIELLAYALVLSGNHVFTSGAGGTHAAAIKGALRAERPDLLTVVLPQSLSKQSKESQELLEQVEDIIEMPQNDKLSLDVASRMCNSFMLSRTDQLIAFAFHESTTVIEASREARSLEMLVTTLFLD